MLPSLLLAIVICGSPAASEPLETGALKTVQIQIGHISVSGRSVNVTQLDNDTFKCEIDGSAEVKMMSGDEVDFAFSAKKITFKSNSQSDLEFECSDDCRYQDSIVSFYSDKLTGRLREKCEFLLLGNCRIEYPASEAQSVLTGDSIRYENGAFKVDSQASLRLGAAH